MDNTSAEICLAQINKPVRTELKSVAKREKAIGDLNVGSDSGEAVYERRLAELKAQRTALVETIDRLNSGKVP